jgi:FkbM family methyltransferase
MRKINFGSLIRERLKIFFILMKEGYRLKDKIIILIYHLKAPVQLFNYFTGKKNPRRFIGNVYIKNRYGLFFCGNNFSSVWGVSSICESVVRKEVVLDKGVAVDIGANCGMYTIPLAKMLGERGKVIAIEVEKNNIELLKKNIKLNKIDNVIVINKGCFSEKGEMPLYLDKFGTGGHTLLKKKGTKKEIIPVDALDNILKSLKINHVDLIKVDVMGVELETFEGAKKILKKSHPKIVFELLNKEDKEEVYKFLSQYNYKIKQITDWNHVAV